MPRNRKVVSEIVQSAPPVGATEALRRSLLKEFLDIPVADVREMRQALVEKGKQGDVQALRLTFDMLSAGTEPQPATTHMQQAIVVQGRTGSALLTISELRQDVVRLIAARGPMTPAELAKHYHQQGVLVETLKGAVKHDWFELGADGYHVTAKARAEVLEGVEPREALP